MFTPEQKDAITKLLISNDEDENTVEAIELGGKLTVNIKNAQSIVIGDNITLNFNK